MRVANVTERHCHVTCINIANILIFVRTAFGSVQNGGRSGKGLQQLRKIGCFDSYRNNTNMMFIEWFWNALLGGPWEEAEEMSHASNTHCHWLSWKCALLHCGHMDVSKSNQNRSGVGMLCGLLALSFGPCRQGFQCLWDARGHGHISRQHSFGTWAMVWFGQALLCSAKYVKCKSGRIYEDFGTCNTILLCLWFLGLDAMSLLNMICNCTLWSK